MTYEGLSKEEGDALYLAQKRVVDDLISWASKDEQHTDITIRVETEDGVPLTVRGWYAIQGSRRYGFALLFKKSTVIRRWDDKSGHLNPVNKQRVSGPHKHYCDPNFGDSPCYETDEIRSGDVDGALVDFLIECNISLDGVTVQTHLGNIV